MTTATAPSPRWRFTRRTLLTAGIGLAIGAVIGALVDALSPNPVYGWQLIADLVAIVIAAIVGLLPPARRFLPAALGLAVGVVVAIAISMNLRAQANAPLAGSLKIHLEAPARIDIETANAECRVKDGRLVMLQTLDANNDLALGDGRSLGITLTGGSGDVPMLDVYVYAGGDALEYTWMTSGAGSNLSASGTHASGSLAFGGLTVHENSPRNEPIDVTGSLRWTCPPEG